MSERFQVKVDKEGCPTCGDDTYWTVVDVQEDSQISSAFGDEEHVEDICKWMNEAYQKGVKAGGGQ